MAGVGTGERGLIHNWATYIHKKSQVGPPNYALAPTCACMKSLCEAPYSHGIHVHNSIRSPWTAGDDGACYDWRSNNARTVHPL
jgi:hypothetical protein